jgi:hypothetical protein
MKKTNYLKLTLTTDKPFHDAEATSLAPTENGGGLNGHFITSWTWTFVTKAEGLAALKEAQAKRLMLRLVYPALDEEAFQLSTFKQAFRGVPVVGHFARSSTETLVLAEAS